MREDYKPAKGDGLETGNVYGDIPRVHQGNDNNRRSSVNPSAQNPMEFRVSDYLPYGKTREEDPIGPAFSKGGKIEQE